VIAGEEFQTIEGYISIKDGLIAEVGEGKVDCDLEGIICPMFINAHSHIGDSAFKDPPFAPLEHLVGPGGLKHRLLEATPREELVKAMAESIGWMRATGTSAFADFREGGSPGVEMLLEALEGQHAISRILGRPDPESFEVHPACWGVGISSTRDHPSGWAEEVSENARRAEKRIAIHAGEASMEDIGEALRLDPDMLIHLTQATPEDLREVVDRGASVVVCPRSNLVTGAGLPPVRKMLELGIPVGVGTDNVMLNSPNLFREMEILSKTYLLEDRQVFMMCTLIGAEILGIEKRVGSINVGKEARVMVIDGGSVNMRGSMDPLASVVRRAETTDILAVF